MIDCERLSCKIEDFIEFNFKYLSTENPESIHYIRLKDFYVVPNYLKHSKAIFEKTIRICLLEKNQLLISCQFFKLSKYNC